MIARALVCLVLVGGCGGGTRTPSAACPGCAASIAQARADTYASVAMRTYREEAYGSPNAAASAGTARLPGLTSGLARRDYALARRALVAQPARAVRVRVVRGRRVSVDVGRGFVIAGSPRPLLASDGRRLGQLEVSIQDVADFVKLIHRLTGTQVVVRGSIGGHLKSSLPAALHLTLPGSGQVSIDRARYTVSSLHLLGFAGEQLSVWILTPV